MIDPDAIVCLAVLGFLLAVFLNYWLTRLAVRGGIEDAIRRQRSPAAPPVWNLQQQPPPQASAGPLEEPGT